MTRPRSRDKDMAESGLRWTGRVQPCLPLGPLTECLEQIGWSIINIRQKKGLVTRGKDNRLAQGDGQEGLSRAKTAWVQTPALSLFNCKLLKSSSCPFSYLKDDYNNSSQGFPGGESSLRYKGPRVRSLVWENSTCLGATKPVLCNRRPCNEKATHHN